MKPTPGDELTSDAGSGAGPQGNLILVVDDDRAVRTVAVRFLEMLGYETMAAENGKTAISIVASMPDQIRCVILDIAMPDMDGIEVLQTMRQSRDDIPIIMCSGKPKHLFERQFRDYEISAYLEKPYRVQEIVDVLAAAGVA